MANTALNRTTVALLTNKSGGSVAQGDVVIVDSANASAFTTTATSSYASGSIGVVLEPNGIASNAVGTVAFGGYVPLVNLSSSASLGDMFHTHSVAKQALRHAAPVVAGDFGEVLGTGTTPAALLWNQPAGGAGGGGAPTGSAGGDLGGTYPNPTVSHPGELGYVQVTASQNPATSSTVDVTSVSLTVTVGTRAIMLDFYCPLADFTSATDRLQFLLVDVTGSATVGTGYVSTVTGDGSVANIRQRVAPSAGSRTYKVQVVTPGSTGPRLFASATAPIWFRIYEV